MQILTPKGEKAQDLEEERLRRMLLHWTSLRSVHQALKAEGKGITYRTLEGLRTGKLDKFALSKEVRKILGCKPAARFIAQAIANLPGSDTTYLEAIHGLDEVFREMKQRVHAGQAGLILP